jgi:lipopolysaccharide/colanic/teichoic acid biosynthesis glycosyltransferase
MKKGLYEKFFKRLLDIILSFLAIILLSPIILMVSILVYFKLGSPVFFAQERPGKDRKIFKMYKFRSMLNSTDSKGKLLSDVERLTKLGKLLRATSLDEIPEIWNVLKGEMSFVGPRPLLVQYLERYNSEQKKRHNVRPGITGWAQVNGRNAISWEQKFKLDVEYVEKYSFLMDIKILFLTIKKVFVREGISQDGNVTMEEFMGEDNKN